MPQRLLFQADLCEICGWRAEQCGIGRGNRYRLQNDSFAEKPGFYIMGSKNNKNTIRIEKDKVFFLCFVENITKF